MSTVTPMPLGSIERAYADGYAAAQHKIDRLQAENAKLRMVLKQIADAPNGYAQQYARTTLEETK